MVNIQHTETEEQHNDRNTTLSRSAHPLKICTPSQDLHTLSRSAHTLKICTPSQDLHTTTDPNTAGYSQHIYCQHT